MIPTSSVVLVPGGYRVTLAPGDHRRVTRPHVFNLKQRYARRSTDGQYHLCLYPDEDSPRCFYVPDLGF